MHAQGNGASKKNLRMKLVRVAMLELDKPELTPEQRIHIMGMIERMTSGKKPELKPRTKKSVFD